MKIIVTYSKYYITTKCAENEHTIHDQRTDFIIGNLYSSNIHCLFTLNIKTLTIIKCVTCKLDLYDLRLGATSALSSWGARSVGGGGLFQPLSCFLGWVTCQCSCSQNQTICNISFLCLVIPHFKQQNIKCFLQSQ